MKYYIYQIQNPLSNYYPGDSGFLCNLLRTGNFHQDEVWKTAASGNWFGLFKRSRNYYLAKTTISLKRIADFVDEDPYKKSGWEVTSSGKDSCIFLITQYNNLFKNWNVVKVSLSKDVIEPGDSIQLFFNGAKCTLKATGGWARLNANARESYKWNYKLYLCAEKHGRYIEELLVSKPRFDGLMGSILFAGDIDGDGRLDLLIDTAFQENAEQPALYLSQPAGTEQLLILAGQHLRVGC